jgi:hypothetical protein
MLSEPGLGCTRVLELWGLVAIFPLTHPLLAAAAHSNSEKKEGRERRATRSWTPCASYVCVCVCVAANEMGRVSTVTKPAPTRESVETCSVVVGTGQVEKRQVRSRAEVGHSPSSSMVVATLSSVDG